MSNKSKLSQTMRIDIHPDMIAPEAGQKLHHPVRVYEVDETAYVAVNDTVKHEDTDFSKLLQSVYDGVFIAEMSGRIVDYNARAAGLFMLEKKSLLGSNIVNHISGAGKGLLGTIRQNLSDSRHTIIDASCIKSNGAIFPAEIAVNSVELQGRMRMCFFVRDVTVRKQAQQALEDAIKRLEEHDVAKTQFVSNVSHELRTPLTSMIYAVTNMLKGVVGPLPDRVRKYLEMMDGDCKRLLGTVNDILDLRKIDNKTLALFKTRFPFVEVVRRAVSSLYVQAERKGIKISIDDGGGRWFVNCDPQKIERVIINIVGNAVKFTPADGGIWVTLEDDPDNNGYVRCSVRDNGVGIPPRWIERVMERYVTVGDQATGSGLGLALSKEIVELHGGGMGIASPPPEFDSGTIVSFILPTGEAPCVLAVDDEALVTTLLEKQITGGGYRFIKSSSGVDALEKIDREKPDLIILDLIMPDMDGTELIVKMKSAKSMMKIPIIVITGGNLGAAKVEILNSFSIPAVSKPWQEEDLLKRIAESFIGIATLSK